MYYCSGVGNSPVQVICQENFKLIEAKFATEVWVTPIPFK